jgi:MFS family permease
MTHPIGAAEPSRADLDADEELRRNDAGRLAIVRGRAASWVGGLTALTGLLGTVLVVQGPDTVTEIVLGWRIAIAALLAAALGLLAAATYLAYRGAHGAAGSLEEIDTGRLEGLARRVETARREAARAVQRDLVRALRLTFGAIAAIAVAVGITWFAPHDEGPTSPAPHCVIVAGRTVATFDAEGLDVAELAPGVALRDCTDPPG